MRISAIVVSTALQFSRLSIAGLFSLRPYSGRRLVAEKLTGCRRLPSPKILLG